MSTFELKIDSIKITPIVNFISEKVTLKTEFLVKNEAVLINETELETGCNVIIDGVDMKMKVNTMEL